MYDRDHHHCFVFPAKLPLAAEGDNATTVPGTSLIIQLEGLSKLNILRVT
jgi:hypothetical protein